MLTHEQVWTAIDRLAEGCGYSTSGLARRAGLDPTTFNRSKRFTPDGKERWPSTESISKILGVAGVPLTDFLSLVDPDLDRPATLRLPVARIDDAAKDIDFLKNGIPGGGSGWTSLPFPFPLRGETEQIGVFALELPTPIPGLTTQAGQIVLAARQAALRPGDRVVVCLKGGRGLVFGHHAARTGHSGTETLLLDLHDGAPGQPLSSAEIDWMARLIWVSL